MHSVHDVESFFIEIANNSDDDNITNLKLQKLLYYAQGYSLARNNRSLFDDAIEAWTHGPVVPEAYHTYKCCNASPIQSAVRPFDVSLFEEDELELMLDVAREYGKYTGSTLRNMTHVKGGIWERVYNAASGNKIISQSDLKRYFDTLKPLPRFSELLDGIEALPPKTDENGVIILPKEYDNEI